MNDIALAVMIGLFGPNIAQWLARFRYRVIFFGTILVIYLRIFVIFLCDGGLRYAISAFASRTLSLVGVLAPIGIALMIMLCVFIASLGQSNK
jgi:hypothetical protein